MEFKLVYSTSNVRLFKLGEALLCSTLQGRKTGVSFCRFSLENFRRFSMVFQVKTNILHKLSIALRGIYHRSL